jgi:hypothetical protein
MSGATDVLPMKAFTGTVENMNVSDSSAGGGGGGGGGRGGGGGGGGGGGAVSVSPHDVVTYESRTQVRTDG